jgi:predicted nucleic acid binding AN1-type Zn finger protein
MSKCSKCNKFSFVTFECKCGGKHCTFHRLPEKHDCLKIYDICREDYAKNEKKLNEYAVKRTQNILRLE